MQIGQRLQIRDIFMPVIFIGVLLINCVVPLQSGQAQAPMGPTIVVGTDGVAGEVGIWSMDPIGENRLLVLEIGGEPVPAGLVWSPTGEMLAFHTNLKDNIDVYSVNADGKNLRRLTEHEAEDSSPTWHPSGQKLAFTSQPRREF